jgi:hypothetical protein
MLLEIAEYGDAAGTHGSPTISFENVAPVAKKDLFSQLSGGISY